MFTGKDLYRGLLRLPSFRGKSRLENLMRRTLFRPVASRVLHGMLMELDPAEYSQVALIKDGCIEPATAALYGRLLRAGDCYVDVGAHVGFHTLVARHFIGPFGRVIAVDPQPYNCARLLSNWRLNGFGNVVVYCAAAGAEDKVVTLHDQGPRDKARLSMCLDGVNDEAQRFVVRLVRMDTVFAEQGIDCVRLIKIDVEGYEPEVVSGLGRMTGCVDHVVVEILGTPSALTDRSVELIELLERSGCELRTAEGEPWAIGDRLPENNVWASRVPD